MQAVGAPGQAFINSLLYRGHLGVQPHRAGRIGERSHAQQRVGAIGAAVLHQAAREIEPRHDHQRLRLGRVAGAVPALEHAFTAGARVLRHIDASGMVPAVQQPRRVQYLVPQHRLPVGLRRALCVHHALVERRLPVVVHHRGEQRLAGSVEQPSARTRWSGCVERFDLARSDVQPLEHVLAAHVQARTVHDDHFGARHLLQRHVHQAVEDVQAARGPGAALRVFPPLHQDQVPDFAAVTADAEEPRSQALVRTAALHVQQVEHQPVVAHPMHLAHVHVAEARDLLRRLAAMQVVHRQANALAGRLHRHRQPATRRRQVRAAQLAGAKECLYGQQCRGARCLGTVGCSEGGGAGEGQHVQPAHPSLRGQGAGRHGHK